MALTSPQNPLLQRVRRAVESGRPLEDGCVAAEGPRLLSEALASRWKVEHIFYSPQALERHKNLLADAQRQGIEMIEVAGRAFKALSDTEQNQGILTLLRPHRFTWPDLLASAGPLVIIDGIQDPGNAGAIIRSTEAFRGAGVAFTEGCVRISNGKLLRAAAGSLFRLPVLENLPRAEIIGELRAAKRAIYALAAKATQCLQATPLTGCVALVVGGEGAGVSQLLLEASQPLSISTQGVESLNAAIACSIALFESARQRDLA
jgi:TrmH family RNA methyltransferase